MKNYYEEDQKLFEAVSSFKEGKQESYYVMYDLSIKYIYKIVHDIIKDYHETEDLVQETYLTIYNKINTLEDVTKFYSWAGRIATNHTLRYIQKNKRDLLTLDSEDGAAEFAFEVATQDNEEFIPENIIMDKEKQRLIAQIIDGLSTEQKLAVQYFYYEEMSVTEIAETMGCAKGTILSRLNYARKSIKAAVVDLAENQGTKLYSLGALPLFRIVFMYSVERFILPASASGIVAEVGSALGVTATKGITAVEAAETAGATAVTGTATTVGATVTTEAAVGAGIETVAGAVASGVAKGALGKLGASLGIKIATGVLTVGLLTTGGILLHNSGASDKEEPADSQTVIENESGSILENKEPEDTIAENEEEVLTDDYVITIADERMLEKVREVTGVTEGDITYGDVKDIAEFEIPEGASNATCLKYFTGLEKLSCGVCSELEVDIDNLNNLTDLKLVGVKLTTLEEIENLTNLTNLDLECPNLTTLDGIGNLTNLTSVRLVCPNLTDLGGMELLPNVTFLSLWCDNMTTLEGIENVPNVTFLFLRGSNLSALEGIEKLPNLTEVDLWYCNGLTTLKEIGSLTNLTILKLGCCDNLTTLEGTGALSNLVELWIQGCANMKTLEGTGNLYSQVMLLVDNCDKISAEEISDFYSGKYANE